ncbi:MULTISPECIES: hypothetical protein [Methanobacterium]|uniref:Uncharacterized protein n=1 Tax=Methanobacterium bryantii TaxID=2161 RepID=A0A2A2H8W4_METBR|nr:MULTISPECIES: hypothetical protein [Methanobacterium]OEC87853.1 hypothetical protein A9507_06675 [Methanobacterium sp. A39]PAV05720.1 hypothetical protein ASJ80_08285 [Methanobacterium bryantii]
MALFSTLVKETQEIEGNRPDTSEYEEFKLNDLDDGSSFVGNPFLTKIYENEFDEYNKQGELTGNKVKKYSANLYITNNENEEVLKAKVNFKSDNDSIKVFKNSVAYDIIDSIEELNDPEKEEDKNVYSMSFKELQDYINDLDSITVDIIEHEGNFTYNTLRITQIGE